MNIFTTSYNPVKAARALDDQRLGKMILETAQILCTVLNLEFGRQETPYKSTHPDHPAVKWALKSDANFKWLWELGDELGNEFMHRRGHRHASHLVIQGLHFKAQKKLACWAGPTKWWNGARHTALGIDCTNLPVKRAYRKYLTKKWNMQSKRPTWTNRGPPKWYKKKGPAAR